VAGIGSVDLEILEERVDIRQTGDQGLVADRCGRDDAGEEHGLSHVAI
jgi:hypothetical protein